MFEIKAKNRICALISKDTTKMCEEISKVIGYES